MTPTATPRRYLMCRPTHFAVTYRINPWMDPTAPYDNALAAIVVGVLALTGSLSWLGTDLQPVNTVREWLDAQFIDRF